MPCYEYECIKCGDRFEFLHLGKGDTPKCVKCGTKKVKKLLSSFGFAFKGFGGSPTSDPGRLPAGTGEDETAPASGGCGCSSGGCGCA